MYYIGIDLGTSAVKILLVDEEGTIIDSTSREYPLYFPQNGWSEQRPEDWWREVKEGIRELLKEKDKELVRGIGCGGQMHGLVILDESDQVIRPAILWNDGRTKKETEYLNQIKELPEYTANIAFAGFTAPKILWVKENEPENFRKIRRIMLPKDYINYKLTGVFSSDYSDASGMLLLDVENKRWSREMCEFCSISEEQLPKLYESYEVTGTLKKEIAEGLGLREDVKVVAGAGDNAAAAIGTNTLKNGSCNISLGTSGTIFIASDTFPKLENHAIHDFVHANGKYHLMGCMLSAASCNKWFADGILGTKDYAGLQEKISDDMLGRNSVYFLPYLMGERSPINDTDARGCFLGMNMDTGKEEMYLAVLEGVGFAIRDSFEVAKASGIEINESMICGGGGKSPLWRKIIADILNITLTIPASEEGPGYGGVLLAMTADGKYRDIEECANKLVKVKGRVVPDPEIAARYEERYQQFRKIYPALKEVFRDLK